MVQAVDVFSFGTLCWEMYHHTRAWCGRSSSQVVFLRTSQGRELEMPQDAPPEFKVWGRTGKRPVFFISGNASLAIYTSLRCCRLSSIGSPACINALALLRYLIPKLSDF